MVYWGRILLVVRLNLLVARVIGSSSTGGLVGLSSGGTYINSSFWDSAATGRAGGKTTTQMKTPETFANAGWDFNQTGVWKMIRGVTYPKLAWETWRISHQ